MQRRAPDSAEREKEHHVEKNKQKLRRTLALKLQARLQVSQQQVWLILEREEHEGAFFLLLFGLHIKAV